MKLVQTLLSRKDGIYIRHMISWLPVDPKVKKGSIISVDKDPEKWTVVAQYETTDLSNIQHGWGLDLPKSQRTER